MDEAKTQRCVTFKCGTCGATRILGPVDFYARLVGKLVAGRAAGILTKEQDDELVSVLGPWWQTMTQEEQDRINVVFGPDHLNKES